MFLRILSVSLLFFLVACNSSTSNDNETSVDQQGNSTLEKEPLSPEATKAQLLSILSQAITLNSTQIQMLDSLFAVSPMEEIIADKQKRSEFRLLIDQHILTPQQLEALSIHNQKQARKPVIIE
jgi:hypothetical protein